MIDASYALNGKGMVLQRLCTVPRLFKLTHRLHRAIHAEG
jgi:hypothetical protein